MKEKINIIIKDVPQVLHRRFKEKCVRHNVSMKNKIIELMTLFVNTDTLGNLLDEEKKNEI